VVDSIGKRCIFSSRHRYSFYKVFPDSYIHEMNKLNLSIDITIYCSFYICFSLFVVPVISFAANELGIAFPMNYYGFWKLYFFLCRIFLSSRYFSYCDSHIMWTLHLYFWFKIGKIHNEICQCLLFNEHYDSNVSTDIRIHLGWR